ncbi:GNAT family N-acetyltransferase [Psychromarinibacter sp. C21-152]|uniref:GNAT family N-acetyltransferase n=1 Tax=Psychromarinibacter sediminicola TaxID=3033385 RepID=A0AAE3NYE5_9RHOB|nr:GNAT family N-acetyltransferase [Psychromarinibacter sediminicola]MDF0602942.1 GNAT family N-acetyltransferase [Psychromarinibacter sediminicola]
MITIRPVAESDRPDWERLWTGYLAFYETSVPPEVYETSFQRLIGNDPQDFSGFIAEADGKSCGLVHYVFHRHMWKIENVCYLQDLYADPDVRGQGVGRKLIEAVYEAADAAGAPSVYWLTQEFNHAARRLYDRIGTLTPFIKYSRA